MAIVTALYGHNSFETAYVVNDYPWGFKLKCKMHFWLESHPKKGYRFVSQSIDPRNGRLCAPKKSTYAKFGANLYLDENGHCQWASVNEYSDYNHVYEFVKNFPDTDCKTDLTVWCVMKYAFEKKCLLNNAQPYTGTMSEDRRVRCENEVKVWRKCINLLNGRDEDYTEAPIGAFGAFGG